MGLDGRFHPRFDIIAALGACLVVNLGLLDCAPHAAAAGPGLGELLSEVDESNPEIAAAYEDWVALDESARQAGALPDPRLSLGYLGREVETRVGPQRWKAGISQRFPGRGKLSARALAARAAADAAYLRYRSRRLSVLDRFRRAYAEYYYLGRSIDVTTEMARLVQGLEQVALAAYRTGKSSYDNVLAVKVESDKLRDRLESLRAMRESMSGRLSSLLGRKDGEILEWPDDLPVPAGSGSDRASFLKRLDENPALRALASGVDEARARGLVADRADRPDFTLGLQYIDTADRAATGIEDNGKDPLVFTLSLNIPLRRARYSAQRRAARRRLSAAGRKREAYELELEYELKAALFALDDSRRKIALYRDSLLPKARQALDVARREFSASGRNFPNLIDAERTLLEFRLSFHRALADRFAAWSRLNSLVGDELGVADTRSRH